MSWNINGVSPESRIMSWNVNDVSSESGIISWNVNDDLSESGIMSWNVNDDSSEIGIMSWNVNDVSSECRIMSWNAYTTWMFEIKSVTRFLEVTSEPLLLLLMLLSRWYLLQIFSRWLPYTGRVSTDRSTHGMHASSHMVPNFRVASGVQIHSRKKITN